MRVSYWRNSGTAKVAGWRLKTHGPTILVGTHPSLCRSLKSSNWLCLHQFKHWLFRGLNMVQANVHVASARLQGSSIYIYMFNMYIYIICIIYIYICYIYIYVVYIYKYHVSHLEEKQCTTWHDVWPVFTIDTYSLKVTGITPQYKLQSARSPAQALPNITGGFNLSKKVLVMGYHHLRQERKKKHHNKNLRPNSQQVLEQVVKDFGFTLKKG